MAAAATVGRPDGLGRFVLPALAIAYGAASTAVPAAAGIAKGYAVTSTGAAVVDVAAGLGLILAGALAWLRGPRSIGAVTMMAGVAWFAPRWVGWEAGPATVRSLAMLAVPFVLPLLAHLVVAVPAGRLATNAARFGVVSLYGGAILVSLGRALTRDPFLDPYCWNNCTDNVFLLRADQGVARALDASWLWFSLAVALLLAAVAVVRLLTATPAGRAALAPVLVPAGLAFGGEAAYSLARLRNPAEDPDAGVFLAVFVARALALACLAGGVAWTVTRNLRARRAIARLAADLGAAPSPGSLRAALARSLGDPKLEVAYWLPASRRYVDADGRTVDSRPGSDRAVTPIVRSNEPVALVLHDRVLAGSRELEREIGAAARLAVDNERLRAEILSQLENLRASRARIVETGDSARRKLERDLHDGAQQRLLALSYDLRVARAAAEADGDTATAAFLSDAAAEAQATLGDLRELAHGIFPAILAEAGLGPALATLADAAPVAVELGGAGLERYAAPVETSAYVLVAEAIADAARREASYAAVTARQDDERLVIEVEDDGTPRRSGMPHAADRIGALGGRLLVDSTTLRGEIPCA